MRTHVLCSRTDGTSVVNIPIDYRVSICKIALRKFEERDSEQVYSVVSANEIGSCRVGILNEVGNLLRGQNGKRIPRGFRKTIPTFGRIFLSPQKVFSLNIIF